MSPRILITAFIFLFCGTMTTLLVRSVMIPEESRLSVVSPSIPFDLFVARAEGSDMDIWEGNQISGRAHFAPLSGPLATDERRERVKVRLEVLIRLRQPVLGSGLVELLGDAMLHTDGTVDNMSLKLTLFGSEPQLQLAIEQKPGVDWPALRLSRGTNVLFKSDAGPPVEGGGNEMVLVMLQAAGISPDLLTRPREAAPPASFRKGRIEAGGESFIGYLLSSGSSEENMFRLYMANTGEILRIKTPLGLELLAETLRPKGAPRPNLERYPSKPLPAPAP